MIKEKVVKECTCPECGYIWKIKPNEKAGTCPACGHGRPDSERIAGYSTRGIHYMDGSIHGSNDDEERTN